MSELTSGEKAFIGLLFMPIALGPVSINPAHVIIGATVSREFQYEYASYKYSYHPSLDLSQITSVDMFLSADESRDLYWVDGNCKNIMVIEPRYTSDYNFDSVPVPSDAKV